MNIIQVWIEHPVRSLDKTFTYYSESEIQQGCRVLVPFGVKELTGFVESCEKTDLTLEQMEEKFHMPIKPVSSILDTEPLITPELHDLAFWMAKHTLSTTISCFQAMLPQKVKPISNGQKAIVEKWVHVSNQEVKLTPKQLEAYLYVKTKGEMLYRDLRKSFPNQASNLLKNGALVSFTKEKQSSGIQGTASVSEKEFTVEQANAFTEITSTDDTVYLLKGVTGSGKTEIYLQLAQKMLREGKQVLILVPEIGLTPQMIERVSTRFPTSLAIYHSGLNAQEKYEQYRMVLRQEAQIVVGTRSAVFLPFQNLGLIVVDEEHDGSYKQENQPCYHARDIAIQRAMYHHCKVILGSATPSLESYARALKSVYHLVTLKQRVNNHLPTIHVVNMTQELKHNHGYILSNLLRQKIHTTLQQHKQVILLLNRRGYHSQLRCKHCGEVLLCPHCEIAMSYHRDIRKMKCHMCGSEMKVPQTCPVCHSREGFTTMGFGTQKLEEEVNTLFPHARVLRMDTDTTSRKNSHQKILTQFGNHEADILLGTQMIAKGLDFPDVNLVGIINGDEGLQRYDYRSCETTFDLLVQASGRSGRSDTNGEVVLQVFNQDHYAVVSAIHQDYDQFFVDEMKYRHAGAYPPYTYLISLTLVSRDETKGFDEAVQIKNELRGEFKVIGVVTLLKLQDLYRYRLILKGKNLEQMITSVQTFLKTTKLNTKGLRIDVNPMVLD